MRIGVVGAGIGGLVTAIGLQRVGAEVTVLERDRAPRSSGSGLSIFGNGWTALHAVGVGEAALAIAGDQVADLTAGQRHPDGHWLARLSPAAVAQLRLVHRADLHDVLVSALAPDTVQYGVPVAGLSAGGREVRIGEGTTRSPRFDVVVAADGIRSTIRTVLPGDPGVRYAGYSTWRGITREPVDLLGAAGETWGRGLRFGFAPLADGRVYWFGVATMPADAVVGDEFGRVRALFSHWHEPIGAILDATEPGVVFRRPVDDLARPLTTLRRGRCVLVGDAAHAMTPDLGQGGNQAMEDAATLATLLAPIAAADEPDPRRIDLALSAYDELRRRRTQAIARRARTVGRVAQAAGPVTSRLRNLALRALPTRAADHQVSAIQAWRPPEMT